MLRLIIILICLYTLAMLLDVVPGRKDIERAIAPYSRGGGR